ncbi:MAG TPA: hypothetical protein VGN15_03545 [Ktedonobacteraceae bacterium]|nr:hypothetical protein [Ktedonobacteraceae bacterium]
MSSNLVPNQSEQEELFQHDVRNSLRNKFVFLLQWWYQFSSPADAAADASFFTREQVRRGRVASLVILGILCAAILLVPIILLAVPGMLVLPWAFTSTGVGILCCLCAIPLNRTRHVQLAGILLLIAVDVIVAGIVLSERDGLDPLFLSMFDLLVVAELIAASLLTPISVFGVALLNSILIIIDINLQPRSMMWMQMVLSQQLAYSLLARPIALYVVVAAVAYLWVNSALNALQRADRAELIAELERRENEQKQHLEQEIEQILLTHVRVANGDLNARAPTYQDNALWQINIALNNLLARFKSALRAERNLRNLAEEVMQLRVALRNWKPGQPLQWHPATEMLLTPLVDDLRRVLNVESARRAFPLSNPVTPIPLSTPITPNPLTPIPQQERQSGRSSSSPRLPGKSGFPANQNTRPQAPEIVPYDTIDRSGSL